MENASKSRGRSSTDIAVELVKVALQGGALNHASLSVDAESPAKAAVLKASVDSAYMVRLLQSTIDRLNQLNNTSK